MGVVVFICGRSSSYVCGRFHMCVVVFKRTRVNVVMGEDVLWLSRIVVVVVAMGRGRRVTVVNTLQMQWTRGECVGVVVDAS